LRGSPDFPIKWPEHIAAASWLPVCKSSTAARKDSSIPNKVGVGAEFLLLGLRKDSLRAESNTLSGLKMREQGDEMEARRTSNGCSYACKIKRK